MLHFSEFFKLEASPVEVQSLQQKEEKEKKGKAEQKKNIVVEKLKDLGLEIFCSCSSKKDVKCDVSGKKGMLSCCECLFEWIGANLAHQRENLQNVLKMRFCQKAAGVDGLISYIVLLLMM